MKNKLLLIGGTGFVGRHITAAASSTYEVIASGRDRDISDPECVRDLIQRERPDRVIHLAAITTLAESFENPRRAIDVNFLGVFNVISALQETDFRGEMLFVSSSEIYGLLSADDLPVTEQMPMRPTSPYAVAKSAAELLCYQCSLPEKFRIVSVRPFNHIGPGQSERFAISNFARQVASIKLGRTDPVIYVGDIDTTRDFTDVRDVADAYLRLLDKGRNGSVYNVCSGIERTVRSLIRHMCDIANVDVELRTDPKRIRANDQRRVRGENTRLVADTGWQPAISIEQTLADLLDYWNKRLQLSHNPYHD